MPNLVIGVTGSVAVYKACELVRSFLKQGVSLRVVLSPSAERLISSQLFLSLGAEAVFVDLFPEQIRQDEHHIQLEKWADAFLVAPCTANTLCKMACGISDNFLTTFFLTMTSKKVFVAPSMHYQMWFSPPVQEAVKRLKLWGVQIIKPEEGSLASGDRGMGRLAGVNTIVEAVTSSF